MDSVQDLGCFHGSRTERTHDASDVGPYGKYRYPAPSVHGRDRNCLGVAHATCMPDRERARDINDRALVRGYPKTNFSDARLSRLCRKGNIGLRDMVRRGASTPQSFNTRPVKQTGTSFKRVIVFGSIRTHLDADNRPFITVSRRRSKALASNQSWSPAERKQCGLMGHQASRRAQVDIAQGR